MSITREQEMEQIKTLLDSASNTTLTQVCQSKIRAPFVFFACKKSNGWSHNGQNGTDSNSNSNGDSSSTQEGSHGHHGFGHHKGFRGFGFECGNHNGTSSSGGNNFESRGYRHYNGGSGNNN